MKRSIINGFIASLILLSVYFVVIILVSGFVFAKDQFRQFWYYVIPLSIGFGIQIGIFSYIRNLHKTKPSSKVLATTGTTSTFAMVSCCSHYLVNILPILGVVGIISFITQYQIEFFWIGLIFNLAGIIYMLKQI
ncbi:hypothetical protein A2422_01525 [Candidatus Woesebacteria bacterium RIFOXYC1_FULL_31_51]|uniref:Uncharacterized protein n=1 Tax=Candidatus Woesebacteria bacterium GW2011_GWC2_31_9 TaxID=1618586 RepID=A0A0F9YZH2_9BACT|nr:MAG: hypothetical protein UR17_C0001G0759 [Candidatus Woesebacteria bacterium GW2011_GWF1_31_35]KKP22638.1 MAG: hypothetical protein UR11_C0002G0018 [Candidatus Woesebacteria bacterium GW2011_GWC1_30_29]KKP26930.1 MAG: hypothetical protein UR13_C0001G0025 [Candidatus Woesebacteria bacterium GW2011_GWD1_31_12]KKP27233.1 MAG: hypothetical protein UR16_C0005G0020 [Candidatus Woesebacteria bacterium GW2011_GWB1_31_29]KKP30823.1 MAG: hypothetical protein UR20_C0051G0007 [Candidatus Woesebacteria 